MNVPESARKAVRAAARLRADFDIGPAEAVCPFDLAEELAVSVRLVPAASLEGVYSPLPTPTILVSVERPPGRRRYTCAHELGHHVFGHGTRLDDLEDEGTNPWSSEEFAAERFAAGLLMSKFAVESAFARRAWPVTHPTSEMVFVVAQELGVGFTTLVGNLERTLGHLPRSEADELRRTGLPLLRNRIARFEVERDLVVVDQHWERKTIDVEVGDVVLLLRNAQFEGTCAELVERPIRHLLASAPGIGSVLDGTGRPPVPLRVCRRGFTGLARYRHLEEVTDDQ